MSTIRMLLAAIITVATSGSFRELSAQGPRVDATSYEAPIVILFDPGTLPLTGTLVVETIRAEVLQERAGALVSPLKDASEIERVHRTRFRVIEAGESPGRLIGVLIVDYAVDRSGPEVEPRAIWQAVVEELEGMLSSTANELATQDEEEWHLLREMLDNKRREVVAELEEAQDESRRSIQIVHVADEMQQLSSQKRELVLQLAGIEARRQALQDRINELTASSAQAVLDREIIAQLEQIVGFHEQKMQMLGAARKGASVSELAVQEGNAELAKARIDLLRAKKEAAAKSNPMLGALSEELSQSTIAAAEQRAVLQAIEYRIEGLKESLAEQARQLQSAQEAERRATILREQLATIEKRLAAMELEQLERMAARGGAVTILPWTAPPAAD